MESQGLESNQCNIAMRTIASPLCHLSFLLKAFDHILMDIVMLEMSGLEVGMDDCITKPIRLKDLELALKRINIS